MLDGFEAGNRHLEAAGGGPLLHPISWLNSDIAPFLIQALKGLRCNWSAMGLQVVAPGWGAEQRPSSKNKEHHAPAPSQGWARQGGAGGRCSWVSH